MVREGLVRWAGAGGRSSGPAGPGPPGGAVRWLPVQGDSPGGKSGCRVNQASLRGSSRVRPSEPSHFAESRGVRSKVSQSMAIRPNVALYVPHS